MARTIVIQSKHAPALFKQLGDKLVAEVHQSERDNIKDALTTARKYSSGPYSLQSLREADNPYAKRHPKLTLDPGIINKQDGNFWRGWRTIGPVQVGSGNQISKLTNKAPKAKFIFSPHGTTFMVARPVRAKIIRNIQARVRQRRLDAVKRAVAQVKVPGGN